MDDLTGLDDFSSVNLQEITVQGSTKLVSSHNFRRPMSSKVDLLGDQMEIELKPEHYIGLDASRQADGLLVQFKQSSLRRWLKKISSQIYQNRSIEILRITHFCQSDKNNFVDGWISIYKRGDQIPGSILELQGWLVGRDSKIIALQVLHASNLIVEVPVNIPRPDVLKAIPCYSADCSFGYQVRLNVESLSDQFELTLYSIFQDGNCIITGLVQFCKYGF